MKAYVNQDACIGCGLCEGIEPEVFFMNDDGKAEAKDEEVLPEQESGVEQAIEMCPTAAISQE